MKHGRPRRRERGVALIEVLVAVLIVSFGLLGLVGLQSRAVIYSVSAEDSNRAALLANEVATVLKLNATTPAGLLNADAVAVVSAAASAAAQLPNGSAAISPAGVGNVKTITVYWRPTTAAAGAASNAYSTQVMVP